MQRFYITTAIDYVNSRPHLGTAYEKVCADVIARYKRLSGVDTFFLMGNDEHSQNVYKSATEQGLDPLAYCDRMEEIFQRTWRSLDLSYDDFIRTTQPRTLQPIPVLSRRRLRPGRHRAPGENGCCGRGQSPDSRSGGISWLPRSRRL